MTRANLVFVGKLLEIRHMPPPPTTTPSLWEAFLKDGFRGIVTAQVKRSFEPTGQTEYVFETISTTKGQSSPRQTVIDATQYGSDCDHGAPDFTRAIGKTIRVTAYRYSREEVTSKPIYFVSFSFCASSFRLLTDHQ